MNIVKKRRIRIIVIAIPIFIIFRIYISNKIRVICLHAIIDNTNAYPRTTHAAHFTEEPCIFHIHISISHSTRLILKLQMPLGCQQRIIGQRALALFLRKLNFHQGVVTG